MPWLRPTLIQRAGESETATECMAAALRGDGAILVLEGVAGIGKSALLDAIAGEAADRGFELLTARGSELEREFAFGVARQLLERRLDGASTLEREALLRGVAADALVPLGLAAAPAEGDPSLRALHGLYWLVANLAGGRPVALCIDDAHWADDASLRWLVYLARRLRGVRLLVIAATRPSEPGVDQGLLDALTLDSAVDVVRPSPLSADSVAVALGDVLPSRPAPEFVDACHSCTGGNPLLLHELVLQLRAEGVEPNAANAASLADFGVDAVARNVRRRLRALGATPTAVARAAAVFSDGASAAQLARMCATDQATVTSAAVALAAADLVRPEAEIGFVHPLVRAAVYQDMAAIERAALHASASAATPDVERAALHLLHVEPSGDAQVVARLRSAAAAAQVRGAPDAAVAFLTRALAEPPASEARSTVLAALGEAEARAGMPGFDEHLAAAISTTADAVEAARLSLVLGRARAFAGDVERAFEVIDEQRRSLPEGAPLAGVLDGELLVQAQSYAPLRPRVADRVGLHLARFERGDPVAPEVLAILPMWLLRERPPGARARAVLEAARGRLEPASVLNVEVAVGWMVLGELTYAQTTLEPLARAARQHGDLWSLALASSASAVNAHVEGSMLRAEAEARVGWEIVAAAGGRDAAYALWIAIGCCAAMVGVLVARGDLEEAEACLAALPPGLPERPRELLLPSRAELRLAQGRVDEAIADLRETGRLLGEEFAKIGLNWRARLAIALAGVEEREEARALAAAELELARRFDVPMTIGVAMTAVGVAEGGAAGTELLRDAVSVLERTEAGRDHAIALVELGASMRRGGARAEAREPLRAGLDLATRGGHAALADRAHAELVAAGAKPRRDRGLLSGPESLTAGEYRVAALAAEGLTNREVAQRLFVTQSAVGFHLKNVFRKLDVSARGDLADALAGKNLPATG